ncbi:MAG: DUF1579 domain-containing protein [Planctomycetota bacterium]|nr:MAG: DUF1579 domain-containing protein [Planctomycetota bacterium]
MEKMQVLKQHEWLRRNFVGQWTFESVCPAGPDGQALSSDGRESVQLIGETWIIGDGSGEMPGGGEARWVTILGYDPAQGQFVGTWTGSMMTHMFIYRGFLDEAERILTLETEGPHLTEPGKTARYRDTTEFTPQGKRIMRSSILGDDGQWSTFMTAHYERV